MAELTLGTGVTIGTGASVKQVEGGETIAAGMAAYKDTTSKQHMKALADSAAHAEVDGIAVTGSGDGQALLLVTEGLLGGVSGLVPGQWYVLSNGTAGYLMPADELANGNYSTLVGYAPTATSFYVKIVKAGVAYTA